MRLRGEDLVAMTAIGGVCALGIVGVILSVREDKKFKEYKSSLLNGRDLDLDISSASIKNEKLDVEDRVTAMKALTWLKGQIDHASKRTLGSSIDIFDGLINILLNGEANERKATVAYWKDKLSEEAERIKAETMKSIEMEKAKLIRDSLKALKTDVSINMAQLDPLLY